MVIIISTTLKVSRSPETAIIFIMKQSASIEKLAHNNGTTVIDFAVTITNDNGKIYNGIVKSRFSI
ncbi:MAG: hypothetical protein EBX61_12760 [Betaproteobacteria bacterium]|nr:hypothetical protein [Betaproteobacteria bacterium]NDA57125.1 hypothetical protein [Betaproteobacteria bacterium]NDB12459.1 hypothetical protein [Betaproteobacteria bacterium]